MNDKTDIIRKVRALLSTAESLASQGNDEAAANYVAKAHELRQTHEIEEAALRDAADLASEAIVSETIPVDGTHGKRRAATAWSIAKQCNCSGYLTPPFKGSSQPYQITLFGTKGDIEYAKMLIESLLSQMDRSLAQDWKKVKATGTYLHGKTFAASYLAGFRDRISSRLAESNRIVQKEAEAVSSSTALVLVERAKRADDEMRAKVKRLRSIPMGQTNSNYAYGKGSSAADRANLARGAVGGERKALA